MLLRHLRRPSAARCTAAATSSSVYSHRPTPNFTSLNPNFTPENPNFTPANPNLAFRNPNFTPKNLNFTLRSPNFTSPNPDFPAENPNLTSQNPNFSSKNPNLTPKNLNFTPRNLNFTLQSPNLTSKNLFLAPKTPMFTVFAATCTTFSAAERDSKRGEKLEERIHKMVDELSEDVGAMHKMAEGVEELMHEENLDALLEVLAEFRDASGVVSEKWRELEKTVGSYDGTGEMTRSVRRSMKQLEDILEAAKRIYEEVATRKEIEDRGILLYGIGVLKTKATAVMSGVARVLSRVGPNSKRM